MNTFEKEIEDYHKILCNEYPEWLDDYIETDFMQTLKKVRTFCGTNYCGIYNHKYDFTNFDHSLGVALIIWNFTKDKKSTLAGLFHDVATPVFKHCIDFMYNDHQKQEFTEKETYYIISSSNEIMKLLERDNISIDEVADYKIYSIADNSTPQLAADRLEYTFSNGLHSKRVFELNLIKKIYEDLIVDENEFGQIEICFKNIGICEEYIEKVSKIWPNWVDANNRTSMQFVADVTRCMINLGYLTIDDLYNLSEDEVVNKIKNCDNEYIKNAFLNFENVTEARVSSVFLNDVYCIDVPGKARYVNPLVSGQGRIYDISENSRKIIDEYLTIPKSGITYFDFEFDVNKVLVKK